MKPYLALYNLVSAAGWGLVLFRTVTALAKGETAGQAWGTMGQTLACVQSLAALEILHSALKLVKSPILSTFMQVFSRYAVLWGYTYQFPAAQQHWSLYLMVTSWALVETPRYLFYALNLYMDKVPFPLFWLRYSLFRILYPSGISGELIQIIKSLPSVLQAGVPQWYLSIFLLSLYVPGSPFMYTHMMKQRKKSFAAYFGTDKKKEAPKASGVEFPLDNATEQRSTTIVNQGAIVASMAAVDPEAAEKAKKERNWRFGYAKHFVRNLEVCCKSNDACMKVAQAGLDYLHNNFEFVKPDGTGTISIAEAMKTISGTFHSTTIKGQKKRDPKFEYYVPYQRFEHDNVDNLKGDALIAQLDKWVKRGTIEADCRDAVVNMIKHPEYHSTALQDKYFVLLGAGSAMGPLRVLLELGCNVIAVDINRDFVWKRLINLARDSPGTMIVPLSKPESEIKDDEDLFKSAGADLLNQTPQIRNWIVEQMPGKQLVIGGYAYLDSALFVRLAMAMDAIMAGVLEKRKNAALAFLCSPTDAFVTSDEAHEARKKAAAKAPLWQTLIKALSPKNWLVNNAIKQVKSDTGETFSIVDGLAVAQGPNYALAKRLQHWRCMLARNAGHTVSTNIAPSTATVSVVHNPQFAAAYKGMGYFSPMEIVYQDLSNAMMTALLLNDICNPNSAANPNTKLSNQARLFQFTSAHFGIWRMAFKCGSIGEVSAMIGYSRMYQNYLILGLTAAVVGVAAAVRSPPHTWF